MKKISIFVVLLFSILVIGGCSCTKSMCSDKDLAAIKTSIEEKWKNDANYIAKLEEDAMMEDITDPVKIQEYVDQHLKEKINSEYDKHPKACMTTESMKDPDTGANIEAKSWGDAFKVGLLEGLIVYPISWLLSTLSNLFGGRGYSKILSIVVTTLIIKSLMLLVTFKQQIQAQRLQAIQPELSEISKQLSKPDISQNEKYLTKCFM